MASLTRLSPQSSRALVSGLVVICGIAGVAGVAQAALPTDTSSSQTAYVVPTSPGWSVTPLLTVGDKPSGSDYVLAGKPDGLGALKGRISSTGAVLETGSYLTILMDHELATGRGAVRAHGTAGAFISQWTVDLNTLKVVAGKDLVKRTYAYANGVWKDATGSLAFDRLCSADLPARTALFNPATGRGFPGRMFLNGEEAEEGRAFAHVVTGAGYGTSYELPLLGKLQHENVLANPKSGDTTLAITLDDSTPGQVYVYVGTKKSTGNPVDRAGFKGGRLYGIKVTDGGAKYGGGPAARENNGAITGKFALVDVSAAATQSENDLQALSTTLGVTEFARPEDGHWDVLNARTFYWATTGAVVDGKQQSARLYKLVFDSITQPTGGTIEWVVDSAALTGTDGVKARGFDNVTVDGTGRVMVQEDGGDKAYIAKTWRVNPANKTAVQVLESDRNRFLSGGTGFLTLGEENSGVIEITTLVRGASWYEAGRRYFLGTNQAHYFRPDPMVEGGQLYLFASPK